MMYQGEGGEGHVRYRTLVGDGGGTLTTDVTAMLYFGSDIKIGGGRALWGVKITF